MLSSLPGELLLKIGEETPRLQDRKSLRRTCSRLGEIYKPLVLAQVTLNIHHDNLGPGIGLLKELVDEKRSNNPTISQCIHTLYIDSLSTRYSPISNAKFEKGMKRATDGFRIAELMGGWVLAKPQSEVARRVEKDMLVLLGPALKCLTSLKVVHWHWEEPRDTEQVLETVLDSLSDSSLFHNIKEFKLRYLPHVFSKYFWYIPIPDFPNLTALSVYQESFSDRIITQIPGLGQPSMSELKPSITKLHLNDGLISRYFLQEGGIPDTVTDLGLVGMVDLPCEKDTDIINKNLTALELVFLTRSVYPAVFKALSSEQIHLCSLVISLSYTHIEGFFDYLQSYSGLQILSITGPWQCPDLETDYSAANTRFYKDILPMHQETLIKLEVKPAYASRWCFGKHNVEAFRRCKRLRELSVAVDPKLTYDWEVPSSENPVHVLLETILSSLPDLEKITIEHIWQPRFRSIQQPEIRSYLKTRQQIQASLESFASRGPVEAQLFKWVRIYIEQKKFDAGPWYKDEEGKGQGKGKQDAVSRVMKKFLHIKL